jgi:flagellar biosynthesis protein FlhA
VAAFMLFVLGLMPGLPFCPSPCWPERWRESATCARWPPRAAAEEARQEAEEARSKVQDEERDSVKESLRSSELELVLGKQLAAKLVPNRQEMAFRMKKMRKRFAADYGFIVPEIQITDDFGIQPEGLPDQGSWHGRCRILHAHRRTDGLCRAEPAQGHTL